jgi:hypothetical protein
MSYFTKNLETDNGVLTFYFNRIYTVNGPKYHVSVRDGKLSHYFMMGDGNNEWHFSDPTVLPQWIRVLQKNLEEAINQHLKDG